VKLNQKGAALPTVIIIFAVIMVTSTSMITVNSAENIFSIEQEQNSEAYYIAESGANVVSAALISGNNSYNSQFYSHVEGLFNSNAIDLSNPIHSIPKQNFAPNSGYAIYDDEFSVDLFKISDTELEIRSTGYVDGNEKQASVVLELTTTDVSSLFDHAIFAHTGVDADKFNGIEGSIGGNMDVDHGNDTNDNGNAKGVMYYPNVSPSQIIPLSDRSNYATDYDPDRSFPGIVVPSHLTALSSVNNVPSDINSTSRFNDFDISDVTIEAPSGGLIEILCTNLVKNGGSEKTFTIESGTQVVIYVTNNVDISAIEVIVDKVEDLIIVVPSNGTNTVEMGNRTSFKGLLYAPEVDVTLQSGNHPGINGSIIANSITGKGMTSVKYLEPPSGITVSGIVGGFQIKYKK
jgi:hypothetical protein